MGLIKETLSGTTGDGSAKRMTAFWFTVILITGIHALFGWIAWKECGGKIELIMQFLLDILYCDLVFVGTLLGLATMENLLDIYRLFKGVKKDEPKTE